MESFPPPLPRRRVLTTAAGGLTAGAAALAAEGLALRSAGAATSVPATGRRRRELRAGAGGVSALDLAITGEVITARRAATWRTDAIETSPFRMLGATWRSGRPDLRVRVRRSGTWSEWMPLRHLHDEPDHDSDEGRRAARRAVDLTWVGRADGVQLEVAGGETPADLVLTLIHPERRAADRVGVPSFRPQSGKNGKGRKGKKDDEKGKVPPPEMFTRGDWGADPRLRNGAPVYLRAIRQVHVHHTVNSNSYGRGDVAGLIRGMYRYHTQNLGWSDIGYNFLVDRFGRIWVGRAGGPYKAVQGAHTLGFNNSSTGVSVIGNFEEGRPPKAVIGGIARIAAFKLDRDKGKPNSTAVVTSTGSDRFPPGRTVTLPTIDGHRDTNETACPGIYLYRELPAVRTRTLRRMRKFRRGGGIADRRVAGDG